MGNYINNQTYSVSNNNRIIMYKREEPFKYEGVKNETDFPEFIKICKLEQKKLKTYLRRRLKKYYRDIVCEDGFLYVRGNIPVLLTAHMDTVHAEPVKDFYELKTEDEKGKVKHKIASPQGIGGDDRCGVWMIFQILQHTDYRPSILFCEDEEIGMVGAGKFTKSDYVIELESMKYLIELDRGNKDDAVFYECDNPEFTDFILKNTGYEKQPGSYSDIYTLSPVCGVASVNLSCGYYHAHTTKEHVIVEEMLNTVEVVKWLLELSDKRETPAFEFIQKKYTSYGFNRGYYSYGGWNDWDAWDDYDLYGLRKLESKNDQAPVQTQTSSQFKKYEPEVVEMCFEFYDKNNVVQWEVYEGVNEYECIGQFCIAHEDIALCDVDYSYM